METSFNNLTSKDIQKELLAKFQKRTLIPECRRSPMRSTEDVERSEYEVSPGSPKSVISDDVFFRSPRTEDAFGTPRKDSISRGLSNVEDELRSFSCDSLTVPRSPVPDRGSFMFGDNSDWMLAERAKSRSPPVSPCLSVRQSSNGSNFRFSPIPDRVPERSWVSSLLP